MKFKMIIVMAVLMCMVLLQTPEPANSQQAGPSQKIINIKFGHNHPLNGPGHIGALVFQKEVETRSNDAMKVQIFPNMQLGSNREQMEGVQQGSIQVDLQPSATVGNILPEMQLLDLPFLFPNEKVMWKVLDGDWGKKLYAKAEAKGLVIKGFTTSGFKQITANKPIKQLEDLKGMKMRVLDSPLLIAQYKAWGSNAVPIDFAELYNSLQQKVVDGQENNHWTNVTKRFYEVQTDLTVTDHGPLLLTYMINKNWYDKLTADQKKIVDEAAMKDIAADREAMIKQDQESLKVIQSKMKIYDMPTSERARLKAAAEPCFKMMQDKFGVQAVADLMKAVEQASK
jgi:tripartite ATP-independent transporter DctP family solute receptor